MRGKLVEARRDLRGPGHEQAHDAAGRAVTAACGVVCYAVGHGGLGDCGQRGVEVKRIAWRGRPQNPAWCRGRARGACALKDGVVGPHVIIRPREAVRRGVVCESLGGATQLLARDYSHAAYAPSSVTR